MPNLSFDGSRIVLRQQEISRYQKLFGIGPIGLVIGLALFGILWLLDRRLGRAEILVPGGPIKAFGYILIGTWICWHTWCLHTIRLWWRKSRLCTTGPFQFVRHPMYAGGIWLVFPGMALALNSWVLLLVPFILYFFYSILVPKEEKMMTAVFGDEYRQYASRTGRLFPRIMK